MEVGCDHHHDRYWWLVTCRFLHLGEVLRQSDSRIVPSAVGSYSYGRLHHERRDVHRVEVLGLVGMYQTL